MFELINVAKLKQHWNLKTQNIWIKNEKIVHKIEKNHMQKLENGQTIEKIT